MLKLSMDTKDMLEYRKVLQQKCDKAHKEGKNELYLRLQKQLDIMDMVFDAVWISTINEVAPQFAALTAGDFDMPSLKIAIGEFSSVGLKDNTQVKIDFKADAEAVEVEKVEVTTENSEASIPAGDTVNYVEEIRKLLSRNVSKNMEHAIELYLKGTGKDILPADAWTEIKDMLPDNKIIPVWDIHIATQYRINNPLAAFLTLKKWVPTWDDVEIGRIAEDSIKRTMKDLVRNTPQAIRQLEMMLEIEPTKDQKDLWIHNPQNREFLEKLLHIDHNGPIAKTKAEKDAAIAAEKKTIEKVAKRMIACMNPIVRAGMEKSYGRKPYVEKGYPAK
jgi:hypothetical protein